MIRKPRSLQKVPRQFASGRVPPGEDLFLFTRQHLVEPILLALATEISLKSRQRRVRKRPPDSEFDLLKLFVGLSEEARGTIEAGYPEQPLSGGMQANIPFHLGMRRILESHRDTFVRCRYLHETMNVHAYPPALDAALTATFGAYAEAGTSEHITRNNSQ